VSNRQLLIHNKSIKFKEIDHSTIKHFGNRIIQNLAKPHMQKQQITPRSLGNVRHQWQILVFQTGQIALLKGGAHHVSQGELLKAG